MMFHNFDKPWEHRGEEEGESRRRRRRRFRERSRNGTESRMRTQKELEDGLGGLSEEQNLVMVMMVVLVVSVICFQKIYGLHGVNHQIIQYSEKR